MYLKEVHTKKIKDSRSEFTIEVPVNGQKASAPAGKSTGKYETPSYHKSLDWNIKFLNSLPFDLEINSFNDLKKVESLIKKKTKLKDAKKFGANALVALEIAILKSLAQEQKKQLWQIINPRAREFPIPVGNAVGGGLHSHNKNKPVFQEFLLIPRSRSPKENFSTLKQIHAELKSLVKAKGKNDEGAWQTPLDNEQVLKILQDFPEVRIGTDAAASSFYKNKTYIYNKQSFSRESQINYINSLISKYNLFYVEDPLEEEDFQGFAKIKKEKLSLIQQNGVPKKISRQGVLIVGDDLTATQISRLKKAISSRAINAMIIKPNQNGSLLELAEIFEICKKNNIKTILSHRSGETLDNALADLAFGFQADFIKCGIATKWREAKLKRLVEIEKSLK